MNPIELKTIYLVIIIYFIRNILQRFKNYSEIKNPKNKVLPTFHNVQELTALMCLYLRSKNSFDV